MQSGILNYNLLIDCRKCSFRQKIKTAFLFGQKHIFTKETYFQDCTNFMLMDYRQLPKYYKYDRIISWYCQL